MAASVQLVLLVSLPWALPINLPDVTPIPGVGLLYQCVTQESGWTSGVLSSRCNQSQILSHFLALVVDDSVKGIFGLVPEQLCPSIDILSGLYNKPFVTWGCRYYLSQNLLRASDEPPLPQNLYRISNHLAENSLLRLADILKALHLKHILVLVIYSGHFPEIQWQLYSSIPRLLDRRHVNVTQWLTASTRDVLETDIIERITRSIFNDNTNCVVIINMDSDKSTAVTALVRNRIFGRSKQYTDFLVIGVSLDTSFKRINLVDNETIIEKRPDGCCLLIIREPFTQDRDNWGFEAEEAISLLKELTSNDVALKSREKAISYDFDAGKSVHINSWGGKMACFDIILVNGSENGGKTFNCPLEGDGEMIHLSEYFILADEHLRKAILEDSFGRLSTIYSDLAEFVSSTIVATVGVSVAILACVITIFRKKIYEREVTKKILLRSQDIDTFPRSSSLCRSRNSSDRIKNSGFTFNGQQVYIKALNCHTSIVVKEKTKKFLRQWYELRHENLNAFIGFLDQDLEALQLKPALVWEYGVHGSLYDVLEEETVQLDWPFKLSLLLDLVKGLRFLHNTALEFHGQLSSRNCIIDSRWVLKVADFGLNRFYKMQGLKRSSGEASQCLWSAPEFLRLGSDQALLSGSRAGDAYSFSIIMAETIVRERPCNLFKDLPINEIIERLKNPPPLLRPCVTGTEGVPREALELLDICWRENPEARPSIAEINDFFYKHLCGRKSNNVVDSMLLKLEKYSTNLEELVYERTLQLEEERKKTDLLLNRMLPAPVANNLKMGITVKPEKFEEVTVYFSDIVGFTTISAYSQPMEVVAFLNDLYTGFDETVDKHMVYKVETIGDAYMVVSGVPYRNADHAEQIALMALDLLHLCVTFRIQHMPSIPLLLRIGVHTGPVVAAVVGQTMPRYCLFGDTVNVASRMESSGRASLIHVSKTTEKRLRQAGGYQLKYRGEVCLKGRGKQPTYWLLGKQGYNKLLPQPSEDEYVDSHSKGGDNHGLHDENLFKALGRTQDQNDGIFSYNKPWAVAEIV